MEPKWWYSAPLVTPTSAATASNDAPQAVGREALDRRVDQRAARGLGGGGPGRHTYPKVCEIRFSRKPHDTSTQLRSSLACPPHVMTSPLRRPLPAALLALIALLFAALRARARRAREQDRGGHLRGARATSSTPPSATPPSHEIDSLGAHALRIVLYWKDVAPDADSRVKPKLDMADPSVYDWSRYQPVLDEAKAARLDRAGHRVRPGAQVGDQRRARQRHAPEPERVPHVHDRAVQALRRRGLRAGRSGTSPTTPSSSARSTTPSTARRRRRSTAASTPPRCAAWPPPATPSRCSWARPRRPARARTSRR